MRKFKPRYIGKKISELPYISEIFQRNKNEFYTKDALMYQDILQFSGDKTCFNRSEVDNWLLRHNQELINDYKDISTRILEIIRNTSLKNEVLDAQKNENPSLVQMKTKELENSHLKIYDLIMSFFVVNEDIPYRSTVFKEFLINLQNKKLFSKFVDYVSFVIHLNRINSIFHLVSVALNFMLNQAPKRNLFIDLFYESANGLDSEGKKIFLYERKLDIEENVRNNPKGYSREYEKQYFANRADYYKVVLEGECSRCKKPNVIIISHDEYKSLIQDIDVFGTKRGSVYKFDCRFCGSKESCSLSTF
jgi:hypothetical protein